MGGESAPYPTPPQKTALGFVPTASLWILAWPVDVVWDISHVTMGHSTGAESYFSRETLVGLLERENEVRLSAETQAAYARAEQDTSPVDWMTVRVPDRRTSPPP